jgi:hypothetical protein
MPGYWSPTARAAARQRCLAAKPWLHATGPTSIEGKARSAANSSKAKGWGSGGAVELLSVISQIKRSGQR